MTMPKLLLSYSTLLFASFFALLHPSPLNSANLTSVKDTLQTSRLSVNARVDATGTTVGSSNVKLKTSASAPANTISTANLRAGDSLTIGTGTYTVVGIADADEFTVSPVIAAGDGDDDDPIYLKSKPRHVITFNTATAVANGYFRVLLPADATTPNDGNPDDQGYDFGAGSIDVVAADVDDPAGGAVEFNFVTGVATASGGTGCTSPANYHCFEVHYSGSGAVNKTITINIGNTDGSNSLISPATGTAHTEATADTYPFIVRQYNSSDTQVDTTSGRLAHIEAVRVTATVDPTINLQISGVDTGTSTCGATPDIDTTTGVNAPLAVPFGTMTLNTFKDASHKLTVNTNAASGYVVVATENDQLGKGGATTPFIPDSPGNNAAMSESASDEWTTSTVNGFGFSIQNIDAAAVPFQYTTATGNCTGTFCARQFADLAGSETAQTIMSSTTVANAEDIYVCYRLGVGATQAAGDYENQITYTATGTF